ncbi:MarR family transcriptional regulator [Aestuariicella hydrocarbonica]|uniref:MarR family transcriptional regulator n=1 Tax=Pseudomaricurvus hydrocarbonicus TaxID=1470433 RepID=A0A9E5JZV8_9GAMM|nr:MarR family transcriptional regulator [Aestuariicella hydrocarbonica]NHO65792.1 MarR family transcriptional regulator [Aestuariicella hydrocarbonica]
MSKPEAIDFANYVPAVLTWVANKLSGGASTLYLKHFGVGIEVWRCLALLVQGNPISAQYVSSTIGLDKAAVSRCFKRMHADGYITFRDDENDKRLKLAVITAKGRKLHDRILGLALEREAALLSGFSTSEVKTLLKLLHRMHKNLPKVEDVSHSFIGNK